MPKRKNLNNLPHNLTKSFFGTERYYSCGYMADWLANAARQLNINEATLDVLNGTIEPKELNVRPLVINLVNLKPIIQKGLKENGFPLEFIVDARIEIQFLNTKTHSCTIYCFPSITDKEGRIYAPGRIIEKALEDPFDAFAEKNIYPTKRSQTFFQKIKTLLDGKLQKYK